MTDAIKPPSDTGPHMRGSKQWLWRVFGQGFPRGHEDCTNRWGDFSIISNDDAVRLAADDDHGVYEFVPYQPDSPIKPPSEVVAAIDRFALAQAKRIVEDNSTPTATIYGGYHSLDLPTAAYDALKAALTANAPVGEPFGYVIEVFGQKLFFTAKYHDAARFYEKGGAKKITVYTHPPVAVGADEIARATDILSGAVDLAIGFIDPTRGPSRLNNTQMADRLKRAKKAALTLLSGEKK